MKELLERMKYYMETIEVSWDCEVGGSRDLEELIEKGLMPTLYFDVLKELKKLD